MKREDEHAWRDFGRRAKPPHSNLQQVGGLWAGWATDDVDARAICLLRCATPSDLLVNSFWCKPNLNSVASCEMRSTPLLSSLVARCRAQARVNAGERGVQLRWTKAKGIPSMALAASHCSFLGSLSFQWILIVPHDQGSLKNQF